MNESLVENFSIQLLNAIKSSENVLVTTHKSPDGDALSSVCLMIELLMKLGKKFEAVSISQVPENYSFLPHIEKIKTVSVDYNSENFDLMIIVDCPSLSRCGLTEIEKSRSNLKIASIDHHLFVDEKFDIDLRVDDAASTTEVIYDFFVANHIGFSSQSATCIVTGILTDTGNFLYPSTSSKTIEIVSEMMLQGARLPKIVDRTWRNKSLPAMKIWGQAMSSLEVNEKYNIAYAVLTKKEIIDSQIDLSELDGVSGFLSNLYGVKAIILLTEEEEGIIKGSLRTSDPNIDVSKIARLMGGGGHIKAAAFRIKGRLEKVGDKWKVI